MSKLERGLVGGGIGAAGGAILALVIWLIVRQNKHTRERLEVADKRAKTALASSDPETKALGVALDAAVADVRDVTWEEVVGPAGVGIGAGVIAGVASAYIAGAALGVAGVLLIAAGVALAAALLAAYLFERRDWDRVQAIETKLVSGTEVPDAPHEEAPLPDQVDEEGVEIVTSDDPTISPDPDDPDESTSSQGSDSYSGTDEDEWVDYTLNPEQDPADSGTSFIPAT